MDIGIYELGFWAWTFLESFLDLSSRASKGNDGWFGVFRFETDSEGVNSTVQASLSLASFWIRISRTWPQPQSYVTRIVGKRYGFLGGLWNVKEVWVQKGFVNRRLWMVSLYCEGVVGVWRLVIVL